jgi:hypothetical protein
LDNRWASDLTNRLSAILVLPAKDVAPLLFHCSKARDFEIDILFSFNTLNPIPLVADKTLFALLASCLEQGFAYWSGEYKYRVQMTKVITWLFLNWNLHALSRLLEICDLDHVAAYERSQVKRYWQHGDYNNTTAQSVVDVVRYICSRPQVDGFLCDLMCNGLFHELNHKHNLFRLMDDAGLPMAQLCDAVCTYVTGAYSFGRHAFMCIIRLSLDSYVSYYQELPEAMNALQRKRNFRTSRVGTLWDNKDLIRMVYEYVIDCSEAESQACESCTRLLVID